MAQFSTFTNQKAILVPIIPLHSVRKQQQFATIREEQTGNQQQWQNKIEVLSTGRISHSKQIQKTF